MMTVPESGISSVPTIIDEIRYRRSMIRLGILITSCFGLLIVLTASFFINKISQDRFNNLQVQERHQGILVEKNLCSTLNSLRDLKPPALSANPATNPSRVYLREQHDRLAQLSKDVGCKG
jgi:hypothetical protein